LQARGYRICVLFVDSTAVMAAQADLKSKILSRREIEAQIANGRSIVIIDNKVLKVDAWLPYHPGGDKAIRHMVGRDATDEVTR
jgi:delta8-fatty-acid desaturase